MADRSMRGGDRNHSCCHTCRRCPGGSFERLADRRSQWNDHVRWQRVPTDSPLLPRNDAITREIGLDGLEGTLDVDFCVNLIDLFPASGTFSLVTRRGTLAGTATTAILDPASVFTLVVASGTRSFSNVSGTIEVDLFGSIPAAGSWAAQVSADLTRGRKP